MSLLAGQCAVVTGAGSGLGRATALALSSHGAHTCIVGRTRSALEETARTPGARYDSFTILSADLSIDEDIEFIKTSLEGNSGRLDMLVHCAAVVRTGKNVEIAPVQDFDSQYHVNVRAPFLLTQALLPMLKITQGQVVFVNSLVGVRAREGVSQYAATKHALKALADNLREEVNPHGMRVLSVHPGRMATPMQARLYREQDRDYNPETLLQPEDVASILLSAVTLPRTAEVTDLYIRPFRK